MQSTHSGFPPDPYRWQGCRHFVHVPTCDGAHTGAGGFGLAEGGVLMPSSYERAVPTFEEVGRRRVGCVQAPIAAQGPAKSVPMFAAGLIDDGNEVRPVPFLANR